MTADPRRAPSLAARAGHPRRRRPCRPSATTPTRSWAARSGRTRSCSTAGPPAACRRPRSRPRSTPPRTTPTHSRRSKAPTFDYDAGGDNVDRLRRRRAVRGQRPRLLPPGCPRLVRGLPPRERPPVRLGHAPLVRVDGPAQRLLRRREHHARRARARPRPGPPRQLRGRPGLRRRRGPDVLADEAEGVLERPRLRPVRRRDAPAGVRRRDLHDAVQHLPRRADAAHARGDADLGRARDDRHVHRDAPTAGTGRLSNNPVSGRSVVLQQRTSIGLVRRRHDGAGSSAGTYIGPS